MGAALKITAKGQVTLRADVLRHLGVAPGDRVEVEKLPGGGVAIRAERPRGSISDVFGMLKRDDGICLTIEEMNEEIAKAWAGEP